MRLVPHQAAAHFFGVKPRELAPTPCLRFSVVQRLGYLAPMAATSAEIFVPGRLCLLGEHSDWSGALRTHDPELVAGACLLHGTDQGLRARVEAAPELSLRSTLPDGSVRGPVTLPLQRAALQRAAASRDFFSYAAGSALILLERFGIELGAHLEIDDDDLPIARGLSSSAAVCVLVVRALARVNGLALSVEDEMELAYAGERAAGSECGRMDQACAFGRRPTLLEFDGEAMTVQALQPGAPMYLLIVDLLHQKDTRRILRDLRRVLLGPASLQRTALRTALGAANRESVEAAQRAIETGDARILGEIMRDAQRRFDRDVLPACPEELTAPRLHALLQWPEAADLVWGGKGVGSQGDGCAQFVCRGSSERDELRRRIETAGRGRALALTLAPR